MKDAQNEFYSSISNYYSDIFPYNPAQLEFVSRNSGGLSGKRILDIGCATGELSYQLAGAGAEVAGIDLNEDLLAQAQSNKAHQRVTFQNMNMLDVKDAFQNGEFDVVLCFGNTLVHLTSEELIRKLFYGIKHILKPGGLLLLQILNYDYILSEKVSELPVIENENIRFVRNYIFKEDSPLIGFKTGLHLKNENKVVYNETPLLALSSQALEDLLEEAGFINSSMFGNFKEEPFGGKHLPLVVKAFSGK
jgi:glycine/sarcosine N-methyltransferase